MEVQKFCTYTRVEKLQFHSASSVRSFCFPYRMAWMFNNFADYSLLGPAITQLGQGLHIAERVFTEVVHSYLKGSKNAAGWTPSPCIHSKENGVLTGQMIFWNSIYSDIRKIDFHICFSPGKSELNGILAERSVWLATKNEVHRLVKPGMPATKTQNIITHHFQQSEAEVWSKWKQENSGVSRLVSFDVLSCIIIKCDGVKR